jgi:hypothetical protein
MATNALAQRARAALEALAPTQEKVDLAVKVAIEVARPSRVILFGSWARGEAKWDSDLDLAVLMPNSAEAELAGIHPQPPPPAGRSSHDYRSGGDHRGLRRAIPRLGQLDLSPHSYARPGRL